jgi:hypothetical protein
METRLQIVPAHKGERLDQFCRRTNNVWDPGTTALMNGISIDQSLEKGQLIKIAVTKKYTGS